jgi:hypothetical protein
MKIIKTLLGSIFGIKFKRLPDRDLPPLVLYYRPIENRGYDQWICWKAMIKQKKETGNVKGFCNQCKYYVPMTSLDNNLGISEDCGKGHYRFEAT